MHTCLHLRTPEAFSSLDFRLVAWLKTAYVVSIEDMRAQAEAEAKTLPWKASWDVVHIQIRCYGNGII